MLKERRKIIKKIQEKRKSIVISLFFGDRRGLPTRVHPEVLPYLYKLLKKSVKKDSKVDLFLYGTGGLTNAAWGIANLLNEFSDHYNVLVPFKALSAFTLIALGAKEIIMTELGQLSPVDPSVNSPYNPESPEQLKGAPRNLLPVPVEDCISFFDIAKKEAGIKGDEELAKVFISLTEKIHPLALGNVYRSREQIKMLSKKLLSRNIKDEGKRNKIVDILTKELYSHDYIISRSEVENLLKLSIKHDKEIESLISDLFYKYDETVQIGKPYIPEIEFQEAKSNNNEMIYERAYIESEDHCFCFISHRKFNELSVQRPGVPFREKVIKQQELFQGWRIKND